MYHIAVLTQEETLGKRLETQIAEFCRENGRFPRIEGYLDQEKFFRAAPGAAFSNAVIALPGVAGLNAAEHLRGLCPGCRIIWCSDLDFSLHAFRLRVDYFLLEPVTEEALRQGLGVWLEGRAPATPLRSNQAKRNKEEY